MKTLIHKKGNLLTDSDISVIGHCTNCQGVMGSGIALSIKEIYPIAYDAYKNAESKEGLKLGEISYGSVLRNSKPFVIFNLNGQHLYGTDSRKINYEAIYSALEKMRRICEMAKMEPKPTVGFPHKMGADRAGGDWRIIERMIEAVFDGYSGDVIIVDWDGS
jgi:O-acetyl-ADP-ribose deacetylase (regulator of RNase III)